MDAATTSRADANVIYLHDRRPVCHDQHCAECQATGHRPWHGSHDSALQTRAWLRWNGLWGSWQGACIGLSATGTGA